MSKPIEPTILTPTMKRDQRSIFDLINRIRYPNRVLDHRQSPRHISMELGKSIANVNKTINDILRYPQGNSNFQIVSQTMKNQTNRLTEISEILRRELENISRNVNFEIKKLHLDRRKLNEESLWEQFKTLYDVQKSSKNSTEVSEIRKVLDNIVVKLHLNADTTKVLGNYDLKEIRKKLQKYSDSDDKLKKVEYSDAHPRPQELSFHKSETDIRPKTYKDLTNKILNDKKNVDDDQPAAGKSLFGEDLDNFKYLTPFSNVNTRTNHKKVLSDAKTIIEESLNTDKILNNFFNKHKSDTNVFNNPELFNFG